MGVVEGKKEVYRAPIDALVDEYITDGRILAQIVRINGLTIIAEDCFLDLEDVWGERIVRDIAIPLIERTLWTHVAAPVGL